MTLRKSKRRSPKKSLRKSRRLHKKAATPRSVFRGPKGGKFVIRRSKSGKTRKSYVGRRRKVSAKVQLKKSHKRSHKRSHRRSRK